MIRDYERGSGIQGVLRSLVDERVVAVLLTDHTINLFFESGCAVAIRAYDHGAVVMQPLNQDDTPAYIKSLIRDQDKRQADLDLIISRLVDCKSKPAGEDRDPYMNTDVTTE